jgi:hypothetical protein
MENKENIEPPEARKNRLGDTGNVRRQDNGLLDVRPMGKYTEM